MTCNLSCFLETCVCVLPQSAHVLAAVERRDQLDVLLPTCARWARRRGPATGADADAGPDPKPEMEMAEPLDQDQDQDQNEDQDQSPSEKREKD